ncbi:hypothetical protein IWQ60_006145 [Tieghemiomyces parasiticus]|uniref:Uncharacterized protein n=1 Tax=Tieghemiomyces parasiticus TaxID=78921 RepID=A0A9W8ACR7_9FUNG|nr:hypothetical protein IWQ60_006145 [Tieghemiomyces parasiticus]
MEPLHHMGLTPLGDFYDYPSRTMPQEYPPTHSRDIRTVALNSAESYHDAFGRKLGDLIHRFRPSLLVINKAVAIKPLDDPEQWNNPDPTGDTLHYAVAKGKLDFLAHLTEYFTTAGFAEGFAREVEEGRLVPKHHLDFAAALLSHVENPLLHRVGANLGPYYNLTDLLIRYVVMAFVHYTILGLASYHHNTAVVSYIPRISALPLLLHLLQYRPGNLEQFAFVAAAQVVPQPPIRGRT